MDSLPHWLTTEIAVTGQISPKNVSQVKKMGFKSIICNRPNYEHEKSQPTQESIEAEAKKLGVSFKFLPVSSNKQTEEEATIMANYLHNLPKPILAYCRSGGRSSALIGLSVHLGLFRPN